MTREELAEVRELYCAIGYRTTMDIEFRGDTNEDKIEVIFTVPDKFGDDYSNPGEVIRKVTGYRNEGFMHKDTAIAFLTYIENKLGK